MTIKDDLIVFTTETTTIGFMPPPNSALWPVMQEMINELSYLQPYTNIEYIEKGVIVTGSNGNKMFMGWDRIAYLKHTAPVAP